MSGPIVRKYGFPNFEKIFGEREIQHGGEGADPASTPDTPSEPPKPPAGPGPSSGNSGDSPKKTG